jgi:hypothetical protein
MSRNVIFLSLRDLNLSFLANFLAPPVPLSPLAKYHGGLCYSTTKGGLGVTEPIVVFGSMNGNSTLYIVIKLMFF